MGTNLTTVQHINPKQLKFTFSLQFHNLVHSGVQRHNGGGGVRTAQNGDKKIPFINNGPLLNKIYVACRSHYPEKSILGKYLRKSTPNGLPMTQVTSVKLFP